MKNKTNSAKMKAMLARGSLNLKKKGSISPLNKKNLAMKIRAAKVAKTK